MSQETTPTPTLGLFRPPLAAPQLGENRRALHGQALQNYLAPLVEYCDRQEENDGLSLSQFEHVRRIREAITALLAYDTSTEELLDHYRAALAAAQAKLAERVLPLELALMQSGPDWRGIVFRLIQRLHQYEPRLALGCQRIAFQPTAPLDWQAIAFRLLDRLHRHEPPAPAAPSALVQRVCAHLDSPSMKARAALPLEQRRALASITSHTLDQNARRQ